MQWHCSHLAVDISQCLAREVQFHAIMNGKKGVAKAESKNPHLNQEGGPTFRVITAYYFLLIENSLLHQSKVGPGGHR